MTAERYELAVTCRDLSEVGAQADAWPMAEWLRPLPDGRTVKDYVAEAAALACQLDQRTAELAATQHSGRSTQHARERRPVRMLARELRECLARAAGRLETLPPEQSVPQSVRDELDSLRRLLTALRA